MHGPWHSTVLLFPIANSGIASNLLRNHLPRSLTHFSLPDRWLHCQYSAQSYSTSASRHTRRRRYWRRVPGSRLCSCLLSSTILWPCSCICSGWFRRWMQKCNLELIYLWPRQCQRASWPLAWVLWDGCDDTSRSLECSFHKVSLGMVHDLLYFTRTSDFRPHHFSHYLPIPRCQKIPHVPRDRTPNTASALRPLQLRLFRQPHAEKGQRDSPMCKEQSGHSGQLLSSGLCWIRSISGGLARNIHGKGPTWELLQLWNDIYGILGWDHGWESGPRFCDWEILSD